MSAVVRWDNGHEAFYTANDEGAYDLYEIVPQENNHDSDRNGQNRKRMLTRIYVWTYTYTR